MRKLPDVDDLGADAAVFWARLDEWLVGEELSFDPHEIVLAVELARTVERMAVIRSALARLDPVADTPSWTRLAGEERQQRLAFGRLTLTLALPTGVVDPDADDQPKGRTPRSRRAMKAAQSRWGHAS